MPAHSSPGARGRIVVALDGPSGAGKSTAARMLAQRLGYRYIDTGAMYRALALLVKEKGISLEDREEIERECRHMDLTFQEGPHGVVVALGGRDVSKEIRDPLIGELASRLSALPEVRRIMVERQRGMAEGGGVVMEGRDIGSVVFPDAEVKIFLDASPEERARRRYRELVGRGLRVSEAEVRGDIEARDHRDTTREAAPLREPQGAVRIDSTNLDVHEVVEALTEIVMKSLGGG